MTLLMLSALVIGCNGDGLVAVSGQITLDGNPVQAGRIEFYPESGRPSVGTIDSEGRYQLKTFSPNDGAKPGKYVVTITAREESTSGPQYQSMEDELNGTLASPNRESESKPVTWLVPSRYANRATSDLTAEVGGDQDFDFKLTSRPSEPH